MGHSSSGSHERYKSKERLEWESEYCCLQQFRKWILAKKVATESELDVLESEAQQEAMAAKQLAWQQYISPIKQERDYILTLLRSLKGELPHSQTDATKSIDAIMRRLKSTPNPIRKDIVSSIHKALRRVLVLINRNLKNSWLNG